KHEDIDRCATYNLIRFELDTTQRIDRRDEKPCEHAAEQSNPRTRTAHVEARLSRVRNGGSSKSSGQHFSFKRDVDHARAFRKKTAERREHEWRGEPDSRGDE